MRHSSSGSGGRDHAARGGSYFYVVFLTGVLLIVVLTYAVILSRESTSHEVEPERVRPPPILSQIEDMTARLEGILAQSGHVAPHVEAAGSDAHKQPSVATSRPASPELKGAKAPRLHAVTYASHHGRDDRFCRAIESALRYDYPLTLLGWKVPWKGLAQKLEAAYQYAGTLPDDDLLLFTDAFDVLFTAEAQHVVDVFTQHQYTILFAAECGCWPHIMEDRNICLKLYPASPTPYRYLNSGTWVAKASAAREMLGAVKQRAGQSFTNANDQKLVADMFMSKEFPIALDYYSQIFQSMHRTDPPGLPFCDPSQHVHTEQREGREARDRRRIVNKLTNSTPAIFHFNGGGKAHHLRMEGSTWYKSAAGYASEEVDKLRQMRILAPSQSRGYVTYGEICDSYLERERWKYVRQ